MSTLYEPLPGAVHRFPHDTEVAAAESVTEVTGKLRRDVMSLLEQAGPAGLTDDEGGRRMAMFLPGADRLTFGRRRHELCEAGKVIDSGHRRPTPRGRSAVVWQAAS